MPPAGKRGNHRPAFSRLFFETADEAIRPKTMRREDMSIALQDDMFTPDVIADPYSYYGRLRDADPVHWNEKYELWVITRHDDLVWLTRHHELFSSAVFKNDPRLPYPAIEESDL